MPLRRHSMFRIATPTFKHRFLPIEQLDIGMVIDEDAYTAVEAAA